MEQNKDTGLFTRVGKFHEADPNLGAVRWSPVKSLWWTGMLLGWVILGSIFFSWGAVAAFIVTCAVTLCLGHSIGMHRKLIHESFDSPLWVEKCLVYLGSLVGMGGPMTMMEAHDMRDWAQRLPSCHSFLSHQSGILKDFWWQLHCKLYLSQPPIYAVPERVSQDGFYRFVQQTSMLQQLPLGLLLFLIGGWGWVAWGICGRVTVSIFGHWLVGYFAHNSGGRDWQVNDAAVQGHNVPYCGIVTFGESWHNNHHAFPGSAKLGIYPGQADIGWLALKALEKIHLVNNLKEPKHLAPREELRKIDLSGAKLVTHHLARPQSIG
jgi:sn-1 stearoyl-lipid 9-desaturase